MMDKRREFLERTHEDAALAIVMDEHADHVGAAVQAAIRNHEEAGDDFSMPDAMKKGCLDLIASATLPKIEAQSRRKLSTVLLAAALAAAMLLSLFLVQAVGINVYGTLAKWSDSVFHYGDMEDDEEDLEPDGKLFLSPDVSLFIDLYLLPDDYRLSSSSVDMMNGVSSCKAEILVDNAEAITVICLHDPSGTMIDSARWEKTDEDVLVYTHKDMLFYVFQNTPGWMGVWANETCTITILGASSAKGVTTIIDAMGGNVK